MFLLSGQICENSKKSGGQKWKTTFITPVLGQGAENIGGKTNAIDHQPFQKICSLPGVAGIACVPRLSIDCN
jgi:hypothetical protein